MARPQRTVRVRFTILYVVVFLVSGMGLLALINVFAGISETQVAPQQAAAFTDQQRILALQTQLLELQATQSRRLLTISLAALAVMTIASIMLGKAVAGRVLRPLQTITAATRRITADNLHERLSVPGPTDEVKDLADTIDELLERLEASFAAQRRFIANASHELRTPLATMRATLDVALAKPEPPPPQTVALAGRLRTELDQMDQLIEGLLVLARVQHGALPDSAEVSLSDLTASALPAGVPIDADLGDPVLTQGSPILLARMINNLIDNAIVHNEGGPIRVATDTDEDSARLVVESGGPVLDPAEIARLGQPFQRLGTERTGPGLGLGLSIVSAIVNAHGGRLDFEALSQGGLRVTVSLPLDRARERATA